VLISLFESIISTEESLVFSELPLEIPITDSSILSNNLMIFVLIDHLVFVCVIDVSVQVLLDQFICLFSSPFMVLIAALL
jgi:hypothetical protein